jgi:hypothetical protein
LHLLHSRLFDHAFLRQIIHGKKAATDGLFAPACLAHCLQFSGDKAPKVNGKTHQQALGDWFCGRGTDHLLLDPSTDTKQLLSCSDIAVYD